MKQILTSFKILTTIALLALAIGCANPQSKENSLVAAGFHVIVPKTAAQQKLKALPQDRVTMVQEKGKTYYVFPDAAHPNQAYVGGPTQYETYRQLRLKQKEKLEAAEMTPEASTMDLGDEWSSWKIPGGSVFPSE